MKVDWETQTLAEHSYVPDLLPEYPVVLDVGCRDFKFCMEVLKVRPKAKIVALDPDPEIQDPKIPGVLFLHTALVHDGRVTSGYVQYGSNGTSKGYGNHLTDKQEIIHQEAKVISVPCMHLLELVRYYRIFHFDLVKLDCEGSEFAILESWPGRLATQISVEFHDFLLPEKRTKAYYASLLNRLTDYRFVQHEAFQNEVGYGHWDSVLVLKEQS